MDGEAARVEIESVIAQLEDALEREVLQMRYIDGHTNRQIAARMRITGALCAQAPPTGNFQNYKISSAQFRPSVLS